MKTLDIIRYSTTSIITHKLRTTLLLVAMSIGVASVTVLTGLGNGAKRYIIDEFSSLGTNMLIVLPGRVETSGSALSLIIGKTPRDLTLEDAKSLLRSSHVKRIAPISLGVAPVSWKQREREVPVLGTSYDMLAIRHMEMQQGQFLPRTDFDQGKPVCVIGKTIRNEIFANNPAQGEWLRLGEYRCRVIGTMKSIGHSFGVNMDEVIVIPVASAFSIFNTSSLFRIMVEANSREEMPQAGDDILDIIQKRHHNKLDITVVTQDAVLGTFDKIINVITLGVAGIAAISLCVAGILIMNVMLISVTQRNFEIGLLKALGARQSTIRTIFLYEASILALGGGLLGVAIGYGSIWLIEILFPALTMSAPLWAVALAILTALSSGLVFGTLPAIRASRLDPVTALSKH